MDRRSTQTDSTGAPRKKSAGNKVRSGRVWSVAGRVLGLLTLAAAWQFFLRPRSTPLPTSSEEKITTIDLTGPTVPLKVETTTHAVIPDPKVVPGEGGRQFLDYIVALKTHFISPKGDDSIIGSSVYEIKETYVDKQLDAKQTLHFFNGGSVKEFWKIHNWTTIQVPEGKSTVCQDFTTNMSSSCANNSDRSFQQYFDITNTNGVVSIHTRTAGDTFAGKSILSSQNDVIVSAGPNMKIDALVHGAMGLMSQLSNAVTHPYATLSHSGLTGHGLSGALQTGAGDVLGLGLSGLAIATYAIPTVGLATAAWSLHGNEIKAKVNELKNLAKDEVKSLAKRVTTREATNLYKAGPTKGSSFWKTPLRQYIPGTAC